MKDLDSIILDLDGTLWDASEVSAAGWKQALKEFPGVKVEIAAEQIQSVSGRPFEQCVAELLGNTVGKNDVAALEQALDEGERRSFENLKGDLYPGVVPGVTELSERYRLFLVSNCQSWYLDAFWRQSGLAKYFEHGVCFGDTHQTKQEMIRSLVSDHELIKPIYIGDTEGDAESARAAGVAFGYAAYGFGRVTDSDVAFPSFSALVQWSRCAAAA